MNTSDQPSADVKAPVITTEADVIAWLRSRAESYGIDSLGLEIAFNGIGRACTARVPQPGSAYSSEYGFGETFDAAVADLRTKIKSPAQVVADLRDKAAKLNAEADLIF